ncbi:hypothetical protein [[Mycoplasma] gypis]|uniref:Uncharacterized protein n=1 Tax=[Mycoplasma] gypis TaxID=92404 RepID=A0ABZ2RNJ9_9BACT|nr:hypothetical protein [[Mycoplasma] gypis]MBN0919435.1 hypothetical protein [[Mycoplasma] gypis]
MAIGKVTLSAQLNTKSLDKALSNMQRKIKSSVTNVKNIFLAARLGSFLFSGAEASIQEFMAKMRLKANLKELGFEDKAQAIQGLSDNFEKLGYSADTANDAFAQFIATGKATTLQSIGIYLDKNTKATLSASTAQQRLNFLIRDGNKYLKQQQDAMPQNIKTMIELKKSAEDTKKALGQSFMRVLNNIVQGFGGVEGAMKTAIVSFTAYKIATIIGNVGIGISKAIAQGGVFAAPVAIAMGISSLAAILGLVGASAVAINSINSAQQNPENTTTNQPIQKIEISVKNDRYGQEVVESGGNARKLQTSFGSSN